MDDKERDEHYGQQARESIAIAYQMFVKKLFDTPFIPDRNVETLQTNGERVLYNPDFLKDRSTPDRTFMFLHELVHDFLGHTVRFPADKFDEDDVQLACDYAVNALLHECGLNLPHDAYHKYKFRGMSVEEIYKIIHQDDEEEFDQQSHGKLEASPELDGESGDDEDCADQCGMGEGKQLQGSQKQQQLIKEKDQEMLDTLQGAKMAGTLPADLERYVQDLIKPENNWRDMLAHLLVKTIGKDDYTFAQVNRRKLDGDFIFPGMYSESSETIGVFVDTSGSIGHDELTIMASEIVGLSEDMEPEKLIVVSVDSRVQNYQEFEDGEPVTVKLKGGGGTDFIPPFKELARKGEEPEVVIYLTDGLCHSFPHEPEYPVIWVVWQDRFEFKPPFGDVVVMEGRS